MQTWNNRDHDQWVPGPWTDEPDKAQWVSDGLDCLIVRNHQGALCGYVGVPEDHEYFQVDYDGVDYDLVQVHGGLTFSNLCNPAPDGDHKGICHVEQGAANATVWWLGFDCAHSGDMAPEPKDKPDYWWQDGGLYCDFNYVKHEVERLATQLSLVQKTA